MKVPYFRAQVKLSVWLFDSRWQLIILLAILWIGMELCEHYNVNRALTDQ